jgi:aerobic-type carbon monoxide dehydrogenase small subunit (CoxS/CutS family)
MNNVELQVNGIRYPVAIETGRNLSGVLRNELGLTGTKEGCDDCECGACMVLLDGQPINSCSYLAVQAQGREIMTVEGLADDDGLHPIQRNILATGGVQCGFCTPGMLMSATALLERNPDPSEEEVKIGLSGNLCRCTGYARILEAVSVTAVELRS